MVSTRPAMPGMLSVACNSDRPAISSNRLTVSAAIDYLLRIISLSGLSLPSFWLGLLLVVVVLAGGNDGLNTVVPAGLGAYYDRRQAISIPATLYMAVELRTMMFFDWPT